MPFEPLREKTTEKRSERGREEFFMWEFSTKSAYSIGFRRFFKQDCFPEARSAANPLPELNQEMLQANK